MALKTSDAFLKGLSVQTIVSFGNAVLQLIVFAILSRLLSREDFGYYAALMGITLIFMAISDAGIGSSVIQKRELTTRFSSTAFILSLILGIVLAVINFALAPFLADLILNQTLTAPLKWMSIPLFLCSVNGYASALLKRELKFGVIGSSKILSYAISSAIAILFAINQGGLYTLIILFVMDSFLYSIFLFTRVKIPKMEIGRNETKGVINFGGWLTMGVIVTNISNQLDKLFLGKWLSVERLGAYYRPAGFILNIIGTLNIIFDNVLFPILSKFQDSKETFSTLLHRSYSLLSVLGTLLSFLFFFNSQLIIIVFFGKDWLELVGVLRVTSFCAIFMLNNTLADCFIRSFNLVKSGFLIRLLGFFVTFLFLYYGAKYDVIGVAIAICLSNFLIVFFKLFFLSIKSGGKLTDYIYITFKSFIPAIPIVFVGVLLEFLPFTLFFQFLNLFILSSIIFVELVFFPKLLGEEYMCLIYPKIELFLSKINFKKK